VLNLISAATLAALIARHRIDALFEPKTLRHSPIISGFDVTLRVLQGRGPGGLGLRP